MHNARVIIGIHSGDEALEIRKTCPGRVIDLISIFIGEDASRGAEDGFGGARVPLVSPGRGVQITLSFTTSDLSSVP